MKNKKGFTLIELLAVIVILGVLLAIAIPSVAKYINTAKKSTYIENVQSYATAARNELFLTNSDYQLPVSQGEATIITFKELEIALENGGKKSSYGAEFVEEYSYVMIVNDGTAEKPHFSYWIAAIDEKGYAIGYKEPVPVSIINANVSLARSNAYASIIPYDELTEDNVVQVGQGYGLPASTASTWLEVFVTNSYGNTDVSSGIISYGV